MDKLIIEGGTKLKGEVEISGAKNSALPLLAATILATGESLVKNVPELADIFTMKKILNRMGAHVERDGKVVSVDSGKINHFEAPYELVKTMRASVLVLGPLVARYGKARVSLPGGCAIGARPINLHLKALEAMGAIVSLEHGYVDVKAKRLKGAKIYFDISTVTGTENIMMAASLAKGVTVLENAAREPEVVELAHALNKMGAHIEGAGSDIITIYGVDSLKPLDFTVMSDRIETGTFMVAGAITKGDIVIKNASINHLEALVSKLRDAGVHIEHEGSDVRVKALRRPESVDVTTSPYPGFPTDMQAQFMALMAVAKGSSVISETIFENRFMHVSELLRMGADIKTDGHTAIVKGKARLGGAELMATDLRASASLVLAGLVADGTTEVSRIYHLDRGYERMDEKLKKLGAKIKRIKE